jgi:hypothetical protein
MNMASRSKETAPSTRVIDSIEAVVAETEKTRGEADAALSRAAADVQLCEAAVGAAEAAHESTADDDGSRVLAAHDALRLAHVRHGAATKHAADAAEGHRIAVAALDRRRHDEHLVDLRAKSEPAAIAGEIATACADALRGRALLRDAAIAIQGALSRSIGAARALRALGEYRLDVSELHGVLPLLEEAAGRGVVCNLNGAVAGVASSADPEALLYALLRSLDGPAASPDHVAGFKTRLERLRGLRTMHEVEQLEREDEKERQREFARTYVAPPVRQRPRGHRDEST